MAKSNPYQEVRVSCPSHTYPIYIGSHLLSDAALLTQHIASKQVLIVTNETIAPFYLAFVQHAFTDMQCDTVILADGEAYKNAASLDVIYDTLINNNHHRDTTLVALGGGVVGDLTGFAAATYQRGVRFIQIPTTLLAQVDASVGGKTAINHPRAKNMIGCFHQPHAVVIDLQTLTTLPIRECRAGVAEVIKYALLVGGSFLTELETLLDSQESLISARWAQLIAHCCQIKALFVQEDEREQGKRALLNLGHTFAHALEAITGYQRWLHGEAVGIGLYCAALLSHQLGILDEATLLLTEKLLQKAHLECRIPRDIDLQALQALMWRDKKVKNDKLRFVLLRALGDCYLESGVTANNLARVLTHACEK